MAISMIVEIPDDIYAYESKILGNLTKRQAVCFSLALLVVLAVFLPILFWMGSSTLAATVSMFAAMPVFLCAVVRKDGQPLEKVLRFRMRWKQKPRRRPYRTGNLYDELEGWMQERKEAERLNEAEKSKPVRKRKIAGKKG